MFSKYTKPILYSSNYKLADFCSVLYAPNNQIWSRRMQKNVQKQQKVWECSLQQSLLITNKNTQNSQNRRLNVGGWYGEMSWFSVRLVSQQFSNSMAQKERWKPFFQHYWYLATSGSATDYKTWFLWYFFMSPDYHPKQASEWHIKSD